VYDPGMTHSQSTRLVIFSRQLATMTTAGLPLVQAIAIIAEQSDSPEFRRMLEAVRDDIKGGAKFCDALAKHPDCFDSFYVNMCKSGDMGGNLDVILERLATYMEKHHAARRALLYQIKLPYLVSALAGAVGILLAGKCADALLASRPAAGGVILEALAWIWVSWWVPVLVLLFGAAGIAVVMLAPVSVPAAKFLLQVPVFGMVMRKMVVARFARILASGLSSGIPILDTIEIAARFVGNRYAGNLLLEARGKIREGESIAEPFQATGIFPPMVIQMISAGQETGKLTEMLFRIADFYDTEVDTFFDRGMTRGVCLTTGICLLVSGIVLVLFVAPLAG